MNPKYGDYPMVEHRAIPAHVGIIMDGNGRWAKARGLPRTAGRKAGAQKIRAVTEMCADIVFSSTPVYWPDFQREDFELAIRIYNDQMSRCADVA